MGVIVEKLDVTSSIPPVRLYKAFIMNADHIVPKILPFFKSFEIIEGDGGIGSIQLITYVEGDEVKTAKNRIEAIDVENCTYKYTVIEGDIVGGDIESITNTVKIEPGPNGGSVYKYSNEYHTKGKEENSIREKIKQRSAVSTAIIRAVETYLQLNSHEYN